MSDKINVTEFLKKIPDIISKIEITIREVNGDVEIISTYGDYSVINQMRADLIRALQNFHGVICDNEFFKEMSRKELLVEIALKECDLWGVGEENIRISINGILEGIYGK